MNTASVTAGIKTRALALGYDACGIIAADSLKEYSVHLDRRIERFPQSRGLYESLHDLSSPEKKAEWARSIVVCVRRYNKYRIPEGLDQYFGKLYLFDGRLKCSDEYKSAALFETYLGDLGLSFFKGSTAARLAAVKAGLGEFGKNNFLYTEHGSWVIVDTLDRARRGLPTRVRSHPRRSARELPKVHRRLSHGSPHRAVRHGSRDMRRQLSSSRRSFPRTICGGKWAPGCMDATYVRMCAL